jgi:hypothetical protein
MFYDLDIVGACENIRREAETLAGENYAYNLRRKTGALDFITSPENGSVQSELISYEQGRKIAKLKILYDQRTKPCQITQNCNASVCDEGATPQRKQAIIDISNCLTTPVRQYFNDDMVALCKDTRMFMESRMLSDIRAAHEFFSERILAVMDAEIGKNIEFDGTTTAAGQYKDIQLIDTTTAQRIPLTGNWAEVMEDYMNNQLTGVPAVVGQGNLAMFYKLHRWSCCNSATPYGEENVDGDARFYLDQASNTVLGPNKFILAAYRALHLMTFNENKNIQIRDNAVQLFTIPDPFGYPFEWNVDLKFDICDKSWKMMLSLVWGYFNVFQADSFSASGEDTSPDMSPDCTDELDGMTGLFGYHATAA